MSKLDEIRDDVSTRSKSLLGTVADILESLTTQNIAFASDFAEFAVAQVRLPTQADDFSDYRGRSKDAFSEFGTTLKSHGQELIDVIREVPGQIKEALTEKPAPKPKKKAAKKTASKKTTAKKTTAKKAAA